MGNLRISDFVFEIRDFFNILLTVCSQLSVSAAGQTETKLLIKAVFIFLSDVFLKKLDENQKNSVRDNC